MAPIGSGKDGAYEDHQQSAFFNGKRTRVIVKDDPWSYSRDLSFLSRDIFKNDIISCQK